MTTANHLLIVVILAFGGWGAWEHARFLSVKAEYSDFREQAVTQALAQEKQHNEQINVAMVERDASIARMRDSQIRSRALSVSLAAEGSGRKCYNADGLNGAYRELIAEIRAIAGEGQASMIDNKAWASAWPE